MIQTPGEPPEPPQQQGISLDELAEAYAESMGPRAEPDSQAQPQPPDSAPAERSGQSEPRTLKEPLDEPPPAEPEGVEGDDSCPLSPSTILEAMLFVGNQQNEPLSSDRAAQLMRGVSPGEIPGLIDELNRRYAFNGCPYRIVSEGAGYRLSLHPSFNRLRSKFYGRIRRARLSQAALDVLAIVAYRQPIVADQVSRLRGTPSGHILAQMVRRQLLRIERPPGKRRPVSYRTTDRFLELFGLESLTDLPESEELEKR